MLSGRVLTGLCILVAVVWAASIGRSIIDDGYKPDPAINGIFGGVIGTAVALGGKNTGEKTPVVKKKGPPR